MDSELLTCLLKFIEYFPDDLSALSRTLLRSFWTTFVETNVYHTARLHITHGSISYHDMTLDCELAYSTKGLHTYYPTNEKMAAETRLNF